MPKRMKTTKRSPEQGLFFLPDDAAMDIQHQCALQIIEAYSEALAAHWEYDNSKEVSYMRWAVEEIRHIVESDLSTPPLTAIETFKDKVHARLYGDKDSIFKTAYDTAQSIIDCFAG